MSWQENEIANVESMTRKRLNLAQSLADSWSVLQENIALLVGVYGAYFVVTREAAVLLPNTPLSTLVKALLFAPLYGGLRTLSLNAFRRKGSALQDVVSGYKKYPTWFVIYLVRFAVVNAAGFSLVFLVHRTLPGFYHYLQHFAVSGALRNYRSGVGSTWVSATMFCLSSYLIARYGLSEYAVVDGCGIIGACRSSSKSTQGNRLVMSAIFLSYIVVSTLEIWFLPLSPISGFLWFLVMPPIYLQLAGLDGSESAASGVDSGVTVL